MSVTLATPPKIHDKAHNFGMKDWKAGLDSDPPPSCKDTYIAFTKSHVSLPNDSVQLHKAHSTS